MPPGKDAGDDQEQHENHRGHETGEGQNEADLSGDAKARADAAREPD